MTARRAAVLAAPAVVPLSMSALFAVLRRRLPARTAYNVGFAVYWLGWCLAFPLWVLGPRRLVRALAAGRPATSAERVVLLLPVVGGAATALLPRRRDVDVGVAAVMAGSAVVNAVGEEVLWRALFLEEFGDDVLLGAGWPLLGFTAWHLAPQLILPSAAGRWRFVAGAGVVGAASTVVAWRARGVRPVLAAHVATDACGVEAARFRLGRTG